MPSDAEGEISFARRRSKLKTVFCFIKYCVVLVVCFISLVVIPTFYVIYVLRVKPQNITKQEDYYERLKQAHSNRCLPWYMWKGTILPKVHVDGSLKIWPEEEDSDRIENQLMFLPPNISEVKTIVMLNELPMFTGSPGKDLFSSCPVNTCLLTRHLDRSHPADAILFTDKLNLTPILANDRPPDQVWVLFLANVPYNSSDVLGRFSGLVNWTSSYRKDSELVVPFTQQITDGKWVYHNESVKTLSSAPLNFAHGKKKKVVWFVNDMRKDRNGRFEFFKELNKYIKVDVFGHFDNRCPCQSYDSCLEILHQYKFYLAFEPVNCKDFISAKFFVALQHDVLPVVMGASRQDYKKIAPSSSFIHVDEFPSPRDLAEYLHQLDRDDDKYNYYFRWKSLGEMVDTRPACRLCALLHAERRSNTYSDVGRWWGKHACADESH